MSRSAGRFLLVRSVLRWLRAGGRSAPPRRRTARPQLEVLEKREVPSGTPFLVSDIFPGSQGSYPGYKVNVNGVAFFSANDGSHGYELWKSDGTSAGTAVVSGVHP